MNGSGRGSNPTSDIFFGPTFNRDYKSAMREKHYENFHSVFLTHFFNPRFFLHFFIKIMTVSLSFLRDAFLRLITISRGRLRVDFSIMLKSMCNRPLLIAISLKNARSKNEGETVTILTKKCQKRVFKKTALKTLWKFS